jgi:hypothetical protein
MKFLYCLASSEKDTYLEEFLCSVTSLRYHNKSAFVSLLIDDLTAKSLTGFRATIKDMVDEIKVIDFPKDMPLKNRSRQLKTGSRSLIEGDFLYVDCDTVICSEIHQNELPDCEIGAVLDAHMTFGKYLQNGLFVKDFLKKFSKFGFTIPVNDKFFNGGLFFVKDTQRTRDFFKSWQELQALYSSGGFAYDQPALCQTNIKFDFMITELSGVWNSLFIYDINYIHNAKIMHFYASAKTREPKTQVHPLMEIWFYEKIKAEQKINEEQLQIVLNPKENFYPNTQPIGLEQDISKLRRTSVFVCLSMIYRKIPFLFKILESLCALFLKMKNMIKRLLKKHKAK